MKKNNALALISGEFKQTLEELNSCYNRPMTQITRELAKEQTKLKGILDDIFKK